MDTYKNIAVIKPSGLGDFIFALPALIALRETFPKASITYLGKQWHKEFLENRKSPVDRVIVVPPVAGVGMEGSYQTNASEVEAFYTHMKAEKFDLAIQLHGGGRYSNAFVTNLGAKVTIGTKTEDAAELTYTIPYRYYQSEYTRWLEVVALVGAQTPTIMPPLNITREDLKEAEETLGRNKEKIIVIHPGATDIKRRWPAERFAAVGDYFAGKGFRIVITGSGNEKNVVEEVIKTMKHPADKFYNKLSINGLAGLLFLAEGIISNDTGPLHLADALGCKTVGLYWCANLINAAPPFRQRSICLDSWIIYCPLCGKDCVSKYPFEEFENEKCRHEVSFVADITTENVVQAAEQLLNQNLTGKS